MTSGKRMKLLNRYMRATGATDEQRHLIDHLLYNTRLADLMGVSPATVTTLCQDKTKGVIFQRVLDNCIEDIYNEVICSVDELRASLVRAYYQLNNREINHAATKKANNRLERAISIKMKHMTDAEQRATLKEFKRIKAHTKDEQYATFFRSRAFQKNRLFVEHPENASLVDTFHSLFDL